jgi:hypothetical protein
LAVVGDNGTTGSDSAQNNTTIACNKIRNCL